MAKKKTTKKPSAKQLLARKKFAEMAKARSKKAKAKKSKAIKTKTKNVVSYTTKGTKKYVPAKKLRTARKQTATRDYDKFADKAIKAKAPGWRKSASGNWYFERRINRSDAPGKLTGSSIGSLPGYNDPDTARDIEIFADNNNELYFSRRKPILSNLKKKLDKGTFKIEGASKLWLNYIVDAMKRYNKAYGSRSDKWSDLLTPADRRLLAQKYAYETLQEYQANKLIGY